MSGEIEVNEFKTMRAKMEDKITKLSCEMNNYNAGIRNMDTKLDISLDLFSNLSKLYVQRDVKVKRHIVSSIFPNNLIFDKSKGRTLEMNQVIAWMFSNERGSGDSRKRKHTEFGVLSPRVEPERLLKSDLVLSKQWIKKSLRYAQYFLFSFKPLQVSLQVFSKIKRNHFSVVPF